MAILQKRLRALLAASIVSSLALTPVANAATYTVTNTNDSGAGSVRQAITDANGNAGADVIDFNAAINGTVTLVTDLPTITEQVDIQGETATSITLDASGRSYCVNFGAGSDSSVLTGVDCTGSTSGILLNGSADGVTIGGTGAGEGNNINNAGTGIKIDDADNSVIIGNGIGQTLGNGTGIQITGGSSGTTIGGSTEGERNVIVNNTGNGIQLNSSSTTNITGNYIGTSDGTTDDGNGDNGIEALFTASGVEIGGTAAGEENVISGNAGNGIDSNASGTIIQGNIIGTTADGTSALANDLNGVYLIANNQVVGGADTDEGNIISGNTGAGVRIKNSAQSNDIAGNFIGTDTTGVSAIANGTHGVHISSGHISYYSRNNNIGSEDGVLAGNIISGNTDSGIYLGTNSDNTTIVANVIGLGVDGNTLIANGDDGITIGSGNTGTQIGDAAVADSGNIISGNGGHGVNLSSAASSIIESNVIGFGSDEITERSNGTAGIYIAAGTNNSNLIGDGTEAGENVIAAVVGKIGIWMAGGKYNTIFRNQFSTDGIPVQIDGTANESMGAATLSSATTTAIAGTAEALATVDLYLNGRWINQFTADALGYFESYASFAGDDIFTIQTNATGSSGDGTVEPLTADVTAPTAPTVTSSTETQTEATYTLTGTKEAHSSIENNGVEIVAIDSSTSYSVVIVLTEGTNNLSLTSIDYADNESSAAATSIVYDSEGPEISNLSYSSSTTSSPVNITGKGEVGASVYKDDEDTGIDVDANGDFVLSVSLSMGANSFEIKLVDEFGNDGTAQTANITRSPGGGGATIGGGSSGGGSSSSSSSSSSESSESEEATEEVVEEEEVTEEPVEEVEEEIVEEIVEEVEEVEEVVEEITEDKATETEVQETPEVSTTTPTYTYTPPTPTYVYTTPAPAEKEARNEDIILESFTGTTTAAFLADILSEGEASDDDGDGIDDRIETFFFGDDYTGDDYDQDGTSDAEELLSGLDPTRYDSDGDGIADEDDEKPTEYNAPHIGDFGAEDSDGDGISDSLEATLGTDPNEADSDGDGVNDGEEFINFGSNPNEANNAELWNRTRINSIRLNETRTAGSQLITGNAKPNSTVEIWAKTLGEDAMLVGESTADKNGKYVVMTETLDAENLALKAVSGNQDSGFTPVNFEKRSSNLGLKSSIEKQSIDTSVQTSIPVELMQNESELNAVQIVAHIQSTVFSQTLIADASAGEAISLSLPKDLPEGDHTLSLYAVDMETGEKSAANQVKFSVASPAFAGPQLAETAMKSKSPWGIVGGGVLVLLTLSGLAYGFKRRKQ